MKNKSKLFSKIFSLMCILIICTLQPFSFMAFNSMAGNINPTLFETSDISTISVSVNIVPELTPVVENNSEAKPDKKPPTIDIYAAITSWTNDSVVLSVVATDNVGVSSIISKDGLVNVNNTFTVNENGIYYFQAFDSSGNSFVKSYIVSNIDKLKPTIKVSIEKGYWINNSNKLTVSARDYGSGLDEFPYSYDAGKTWTSNKELIILTEGLYNIYVKDKAGNINMLAYEATYSLIKEKLPTIVDYQYNSVDTVTQSTKEEESLEDYAFDDYANNEEKELSNIDDANNEFIQVSDNETPIEETETVNVDKKYSVSSIFMDSAVVSTILKTFPPVLLSAFLLSIGLLLLFLSRDGVRVICTDKSGNIRYIGFAKCKAVDSGYCINLRARSILKLNAENIRIVFSKGFSDNNAGANLTIKIMKLELESNIHKYVYLDLSYKKQL